MFTAAHPQRGRPSHTGPIQASPPIPVIEGAPADIRAALEMVRRQPASVEHRHALADSLRANADYHEAIEAFRTVIAMAPNRGIAYRDLGNVLTDSGNPEEGAEQLRLAVQLMPDEPTSILGLIRILNRCQRTSEAEPLVDLLANAADAHPNDSRRRLYHGLALSQVNRLDDAIAGVRRALIIDHRDAEAWDYLGMLLVDRRDWDAARTAYDRALEIAPERPQALFNRASLRLRLGDLKGGFADYEARWDSPLFTTPRQDYGVPRWRGEPLNGQALLIHTEQGLGDTIQFARFIGHAWASGAGRVVLECEDSMVRLLSATPCVDEVVRRGQPIPNVDLHAPLMSLAHFAGTTLDTVANAKPYMGVDTVRRELQQRRPGIRLRVGIVWEGSRTGGAFREKSVPLEFFAPLTERRDLEVVSLQKGPGTQALASSPLRSRVTELGSRLVDFRDTAEVLAQLDLVVSVDTAVSHLAGAMGIPVWTLVPHRSDWRWLLNRSDSPWYPSMRLFRQEDASDWSPVMARIMEAIDSAIPTATVASVRFTPRATIAPDAALLAAMKHAEQGEFLEAAHAYNSALVIDGTNPDVWNNFGIALAKCNRLPESREAFERAVAINPLHEQACSNLAAVGLALRSAARPAQGDASQPRFALDWQVGASSGWGIYGMNLVAHTLRRGQYTPVLFHEPQLDGATALQRTALQGISAGRTHAAEVMKRNGECPFPTLHALGNGLQMDPLGATLRSTRRLGIVFFEDSRLAPDTLARGRTFDRIVAGSTWNAELLRAHGLNETVLVIQGIDTSVFRPAPRTGRYPNRFVVFSGGKLEYRKGQDLVVAAFARFRQRHPDALLMVAWHNHWPHTIGEIVTAGHVRDVPTIATGGQLEIVPWLERYGIPSAAVIDLGLVPNAQMASLVREADVALFPNRAEGGTNLVAMETLACGIPCIISANTGHLDLTSDEHNVVLHEQGHCRPTSSFACTDGWGESSVDEIVEALEFSYAQRDEVHRRATSAAAMMAGASWHNQIDRLFDAVGDVMG